MADHLHLVCKWSVCVTKLENEVVDMPFADVRNLDILDINAVKNLLSDVNPDYIFHLAAQSSVALSWKNPQLTVDVNIKGAVNVLDAVRECCPKARVLVIGSGEEYGAVTPEICPISEDTTAVPQNIYAATKLCQENISIIYAKAYNLDVMAVRAFNHIGVGQSPRFVAADFASQIANIEKGSQPPVIKVGNLSAKRDFTDVRDIVRAYSMIIEKGKSGEIYNVGSGNAVKISDILDTLLSFSNEKIAVEVDESKFRPIDIPLIEADITKIKRDTGWEPQIDIKQTLSEILDSFR